MGSENYLCLRRLEMTRRRQGGLFDSPARTEMLNALTQAAENSNTGLRQELPLRVPEQLWESVRRESELCAGKACPQRESCLWKKDLAQARAAQIVVVNHHLFFAGMCGLPWDAAILDEAHNIEDVSAQYLGVSISKSEITRTLDGVFNLSGKRGSAARIILAETPEGDEISSSLDHAQTVTEDFFAAALRCIVKTRNRHHLVAQVNKIDKGRVDVRERIVEFNCDVLYIAPFVSHRQPR